VAVRRTAKRDSYHHGDLRAALVDTAVELIGERGVSGFSLAEASRRLGVAVSAPYRHFADREELVLAAGVRACQLLVETAVAESVGASTPTDRLVGAARGYVRFATAHPALFETILGQRSVEPLAAELEEALLPLKTLFGAAARDLSSGDAVTADMLGVAVAATAHGHAEMQRRGAFGADGELAISRAGAAVRALITGRDALRA
jgi:AcrR family transcriptional regulator